MDILRSTNYVGVVLIITFYNTNILGFSEVRWMDAIKYYKGNSFYVYIYLVYWTSYFKLKLKKTNYHLNELLETESCSPCSHPEELTPKGFSPCWCELGDKGCEFTLKCVNRDLDDGIESFKTILEELADDKVEIMSLISLINVLVYPFVSVQDGVISSGEKEPESISLFPCDCT